MRDKEGAMKSTINLENLFNQDIQQLPQEGFSSWQITKSQLG